MTEKNFRPASAFTLFCVEVQMLHLTPPSVLQRFKFHCASVYVVVGCDAVSVFWTHTLLKCKMGALSVSE